MNKEYFLLRDIMDFIADVWKYEWCRMETITCCRFAYLLLGDWESSNGDYYLNFTYNDDAESFSTNLPMPHVIEKHYYEIIDNELLRFYSAHDNEMTWSVFKLSISEMSLNTMTVYCYENNTTITLYRK